jgi:hypothetical protein
LATSEEVFVQDGEQQMLPEEHAFPHEPQFELV